MGGGRGGSGGWNGLGQQDPDSHGDPTLYLAAFRWNISLKKCEHSLCEIGSKFRSLCYTVSKMPQNRGNAMFFSKILTFMMV